MNVHSECPQMVYADRFRVDDGDVSIQTTCQPSEAVLREIHEVAAPGTEGPSTPGVPQTVRQTASTARNYCAASPCLSSIEAEETPLPPLGAQAGGNRWRPYYRHTPSHVQTVVR